jgi:hypothetical protein
MFNGVVADMSTDIFPFLFGTSNQLGQVTNSPRVVQIYRGEAEVNLTLSMKQITFDRNKKDAIVGFYCI